MEVVFDDVNEPKKKTYFAPRITSDPEALISFS